MRSIASLLTVLVACASAGRVGDQDHQGIDAPGAEHDATGPTPNPDTGGGGGTHMVTLTQTPDLGFDTVNDGSCRDGYELKENEWVRVFPLAEHGVTGGFHVDRIKAGIDDSVGSPEIQVKVGTYAGTLGNNLDPTRITTLGSATATIPSSHARQWLSVPISADVPAGANLIVQLYSPDLSGKYIGLGLSAGNETRTGYRRAPFCNEATLQATATSAKLLITVDGSW